MIDPRTIVRRYYSGNGDLDLTVGPPFAGEWCPAHIRIHFRDITGSTGVDDAETLNIYLDSDEGVEHDVQIIEPVSAGLNQDVFLRWRTMEEAAGYVFADRDMLRFDWTNPDTSGNLGWGLEIGFAPMS